MLYPCTMHLRQAPTHKLELRVREIQQLFNSLDPAPFLNKDLDHACETFIDNWALALPPDSHLHLDIHVEQLPDSPEVEELLADAIHNFYSFKIETVRGELKQLLRQGRKSLAIGLAFVTCCLLAGEVISSLSDSPTAKIARESLTIIGWVAMWRPAEIFLYDWWPLTGRIKVFENLRFARISVTERAHAHRIGN